MRSTTLLLPLGCFALAPISIAQQWAQRSPAAAPAARNSHAMAFDIARGYAVAFGGYDGNNTTALGDTWAYDGTNWAQRTPSAAPEARWGHAMVFDQRRARTVLFGGFRPSVGSVADTWEFDGTNWTQIVTANAPAGRSYHAMTYDAVRNRTIVFGGLGNASATLGDTWTFDGGDWTQVATTLAPSARRGAGFAFDSARGVSVLFGGGNGTATTADTWTFDGTSWTQRTTTNAPSARWQSAMTFDAIRNRILLHGGADTAYATNYGNTWEWDGNVWAQTATTGPSARHGARIAYDTRRGAVVLAGGRGAAGFVGDTWEKASLLATSLVFDNFANPPIDPSRWIIRTAGVPLGGTSVTHANGECVIQNRGHLVSATQFPPSSHPIVRISGSWRFGTNQDIFSVLLRSDGVPTGAYGETRHGVHLNAWMGSQSWTILSNSSQVILGPVQVEGTNFSTVSNVTYYFTFTDYGQTLVGEVVGPNNQWVRLTTNVIASASTHYHAVMHNREATDGWHQAYVDNLLIESLAPTPTATFTTYGTGCQHSTGMPQLSTAPASAPRLGQTLQLRLSNLPTDSAQLPFGFFATRNESAIGLPLPFSMARYGMNADCLQYVDPDSGLVFTLANNAGTANWDLGIPNDPALLQLSVFFQGMVIDWALADALPAAVTNAGVATIGR
jgi:hypothetical protein